METGPVRKGVEGEEGGQKGMSRSAFIDIGIAVVLAALSIVGSYARASLLDPVIFEYGGCTVSNPCTTDIWFDGDTARNYYVSRDRSAPQDAFTARHPLMKLFFYPPVRILRWLGAPTIKALRMWIAFVSGMWTVTLLLLLRLSGCRRWDAALFTILGAVSASAMFWFAVPETFPLSSLMISLALCLTSWPKRISRLVRYSIVNVLTLTMVVSDWMIGLLVSALRLPVRQAWQVAVNGWFIICVLWGVQKMLFPRARFFVGNEMPWAYFYAPRIGRLMATARAYVFHSIIMPEIHVKALSSIEPRVMTVQASLPGSGSALGGIAAGAWFILLLLGIWTIVRVEGTGDSKLGRLCVAVAVAQLGFYSIFGRETFLYSMEFVPVLVVIAAAVSTTKRRVIGLCLATIVVVLGGVNNLLEYNRAVIFITNIGSLVHPVTHRF